MLRDEAYLLEMLQAAQRIRHRAQGVTWDRFQADEDLQDIVLRRIQLIGEAARAISAPFKTAHPEVPWPQIVGMRHRLVHRYFDVNLEVVWGVVQEDVPALIALLEPLVPPPPPATT